MSGAAGATVADTIPLVDVGALAGGDRAARLATARRVREVCETIGFMYITNHGVPRGAVEDALATTRGFFALPLDAKMRYDIARIGRHRGYVPIGGLTAGAEGEVDEQEGFEVALELPESDADYRAGSYIYGPNVWPHEVAGFREAIYGYFDHMLALGHGLFRLFALALELPEDFFLPAVSKPMAQLRLVRYPTQPPASDERRHPGVGAHTDYECFTILWQSDRGLEVRTPDGRWIEAPPVADTFVINIGDMMQRWTNDLFVSTPHRVLNVTGRERYSLPFFFGANHDTVVRPLAACTGPGRPPRYPPTRCGYWTERMHTEAYAYRRRDRGRLPSPELESI